MNLLEPYDRISIDPEICLGKPCIKGTRLTVEGILELLAASWTNEEIQNEYRIEKEDILAVLNYAKQVIQQEKIYKITISNS